MNKSVKESIQYMFRLNVGLKRINYSLLYFYRINAPRYRRVESLGGKPQQLLIQPDVRIVHLSFTFFCV